MAVSVEQLRAYTGAANGDNGFLGECIAQASALVVHHVGTAIVPVAVSDRAVLEVASELFHRRQAPNGVLQFSTFEGSNPVRVARDPMVAAYPILTPFMGSGIA